ncbi:hypothetical protein R2F61_03910 [Mollicutes bacterium LVI A0078]|nr:hypothetical protein RZE84_03935 [Mollicutes bacterium LVI A0075]WOO91708.1 hypothetical protein R2F61_03910 [Mollicutes bacterium LVI A0078]
MIELYKRTNDRTINKTVKKIMKRTRKDDWKYFRIGVEMRGGDMTLAKEIIVRELEFMNTKPYEELLTYHPKKFMKALGGTRWAKSGLEFYPGASHEYIYIGKYLSSYKDEKGLLDVELVNKDFEIIERDIFSYGKNLCENEIKNENTVEPLLKDCRELLEFFPDAKDVYVCDKTKTIVVFFEFRVMYYEPKAAKMRLDSWRYDSAYYIKDEKVLKNQLSKIDAMVKELNIPYNNSPDKFIYWANTEVSKKQIQDFLFLCNSIGCGSIQYYKECKANILKSEYTEKYKNYTIRDARTTFDPFTGNKECRIGDFKLVSNDFSTNQTYKELYE